VGTKVKDQNWLKQVRFPTCQTQVNNPYSQFGKDMARTTTILLVAILSVCTRTLSLLNRFPVRGVSRTLNQRVVVVQRYPLELGCTMMKHIYAESAPVVDLELNDFEDILDAVYTFKKLFDDVDISIKFVVPSEEPWPTKLHGLRLGKRLEKLFTTKEFFDKHQDKVDALKSLGMDATMSSLVDDWDMIKYALRQYKTVFGDIRVPSKFVVPDTNDWPRVTRGLKLGVRVAAIRSAGRYVKDHPERKAELEALGFEWRLREQNIKEGEKGTEQFEQIMEALHIYKSQVDADLHVPVTFVVPSEANWPHHLQGFPLGRWVNSIRDKDSIVAGFPEREERLSEIGFVWEGTGRTLYSKKRFDTVYSALVTYKNLYGNLLVPQIFVVPSSEPWPQITWGLKLGARVNAIRSQGTLLADAPDRRELLDQLGFTWELPSSVKRAKKKLENELKALSDGTSAPKVGKDHGRTGPKPTPYNLDVNSGLTFGGFSGTSLTSTSSAGFGSSSSSGSGVMGSSSSGLVGGSSSWPSDEDYDPDDQRMGQQNRQNNLNFKLPGKLSGERRSLMNFDPSRMFEPSAYREVAAEALGMYMRDREYSSDPDVRQWSHFEGHLNPERFHKTISRNIPTEDIKWMKKVGYRILEFGRFSWDDFANALTIYHNHFGNSDVPHDFVVDEEKLQQNIGFTEQLEDFALGEAVQGVRIGDIDGLEDAARRKFLDSLDFDWGDKKKYQRFRFPAMLLGLKVFKHLHGIPLPQHDFVVPDEPQWPYWMVGMPLGEWAAIARVQQKMIEEHYKERMDMLNALEFIWWVPPGPISPKWHRPVR